MADGNRSGLVRERLDAVRAELDRRGARAALLRTRRNFAWATVGGENHVLLASDQGVAALLVTPDTAIVLTATNEAARLADEEMDGLAIPVEALPWHDPTAIDEAATRIAGGTPLDDDALEPALLPIRSILGAPEIERITFLAGRAAAAAASAVAGARPGMREHEVVGSAVGALVAEGIRVPVALAAADDRIEAYRHPLPTGTAVERRIMLVLVVERWGLHAAVTRFAELATPDAELERRMGAAGRVHAAMVAATRPDRTLGDVLAAARAAYAEEGYPDEWELHHQGGIIGYQARERIAAPGDPTVIRPGMAFAWNPSITGAKAEETILLTEEGPRVLTS